jgi:hypothetical protein
MFRIFSNVQNLFRIFSEFWVIFRIFKHFSEFLAQNRVYSESLDFVVNAVTVLQCTALSDRLFHIFRLFFILSLTQLYRYTPEIFLFSTAIFKYKYRASLRRIGQEYSAKVAFSIFQSLKRIQSLPVRSKLI